MDTTIGIENPLYGYGYDAQGVWINTGTWYADPYSLYTDLLMPKDKYYLDAEILNYSLSTISQQQDLYIFYSAVLSDRNIPINPVPEPSTLGMFGFGLVVVLLIQKFFKKAY